MFFKVAALVVDLSFLGRSFHTERVQRTVTRNNEMG